MGSLFTRIFLSFWLAALLMGAAFFAAEHYLGRGALDRFVGRVDAHVETAAALTAEDGVQAASRWLAGMRGGGRVHMLLLDHRLRPLPGQHLPRRLQRHLDGGFQPGVTHLWRGMYAVVRPIPGTEPTLHLGAVSWVSGHGELAPVLRFAIAVLVSGLVCFGLAAFITRPVRRLRAAARALADGNLSARVGHDGRDELAALSRDFDVMADRVRDLLEAQRRLLRDVSHELRSPLARLRVSLELARQKGDNATALERIGRETERLESLVTDVLSLSRLEAGKTRLDWREVRLDELVGEVVRDAEFEAEAEGKRVCSEIDGAVTVTGDAVLLRSAVENVVRNALRYSPEGSAVEVALSRDERGAIIEVRDHGPGVPADAIARLFEPFARVGDARERTGGGYGLGLAITRRAVALHGGTVTAANAGDGGLVVTVRIPEAASRGYGIRSP